MDYIPTEIMCQTLKKKLDYYLNEVKAVKSFARIRQEIYLCIEFLIKVKAGM